MVWALVILAVGCGDDDVPDPVVDAGPGEDASTEPDAGSPEDAGPPDAPPPIPPAPPFRNPLPDATDEALATASLTLLETRCDACHAITRQRLRHWAELSTRSLDACLTDLDVLSEESARAMLDCLRVDAADPETPYTPHNLGIYTTNAHLDWFAHAFSRAYGDDAATKREGFEGLVAMPRGTAPRFTQAEFDEVAEWFARGLPLLDEQLDETSPTTECVPYRGPAVTAHLDAMHLDGWGARAVEAGMLMHGCADASTSQDCLEEYPNAEDTEYGTGWSALEGSTIRVLYEQDYSSRFWTRSSPDGRFVGHGTEDGATIIDLADESRIEVDAYYDPAFFPDNSGFMFQRRRALTCPISVLSDPPSIVDTDTPGCGEVQGVGLYQHVGAALAGEDYWAVAGQFESDEGGHGVGDAFDGRPNHDPDSDFNGRSRVTLTAMINTGTTFERADGITIASPGEGDHVLSPSSRLLVSRLRSANGKQTFMLREIVVSGTAPDYEVELPEVGRICESGGKPAFSYDERWLVIHHYFEDEDAEDLGIEGDTLTAFQEKRASNLYLIDLRSGAMTRITRVDAGQFALYPHFRADGWIYFQVRDPLREREYVLASDAALVLEGR